MPARQPRPIDASVVIPTFNRCEELARVIAALSRQHVPEWASFEVIVVDDGSSDGTWDWLCRCRPGFPLRLERQANSGPARARNRGMGAATGSVILFLGDDTEPAPSWLHEHLEAHRLGGRDEGMMAVVGYTSFPASCESSFLAWINEFGAQFGYLLIDRADEVPFNFLYTSNLSLSRSVLERTGGFREDFPAAAWEDIELAYRAVRAGMRIEYRPAARVVHRHRIRPGSFSRRQRMSGRSAAIFARLHPELEGFLGIDRARRMSRWSSVVWTLLHLVVVAGESLPGGAGAAVYQRYLDLAYRAGVAEGLREQAATSR